MAPGPDFAFSPPAGGYCWWYLDGTSDDGRHGITLIAFVGSVFSPYYFAARRRRPDTPAAQHVALNVALYGPGGSKRWAMTERSARQLDRSAGRYALHRSALEWDGTRLRGTIDERCAPFGQRLKGHFTLHTEATATARYCLNPQGKHFWGPIAPAARLELEFSKPTLRWAGAAYFDHNRGNTPLDSAFDEWTWSRRHQGTGTEVLYECLDRSGGHSLTALYFDAQAQPRPIEAELRGTLPSTLWRIRRDSRIPGARVLRTFEDTPFYARNLLSDNHGARAVSENLDLHRFRSRWVQTLLPFRMPRRP